MPTLHRNTDRPGFFIKGLSHGKPVRFDLTAEGEQYLLTTLGLHDGSKFTADTLKWLYRRQWVVPSTTPLAETVELPPDRPPPAAAAEPPRYESNPVVYQGVVQIRLTASDHVLVDQSTEEVVRILARTQVAVAGPIPQPVRIEPYHVLRDTGRRTYEIRRYRRLLQVRNPRRQTVEAMNQFALPREVDVQVQMLPPGASGLTVTDAG
ncbi:MAG: 30S ribosomal protein S10 [Gemmataceae bacterium]